MPKSIAEKLLRTSEVSDESPASLRSGLRSGPDELLASSWRAPDELLTSSWRVRGANPKQILTWEAHSGAFFSIWTLKSHSSMMLRT